MTDTESIRTHLHELIELAEKATPGPWQYYWGWNTVHTREAVKDGKRVIVADFCNLHLENRKKEEIRDDMALIATSRTALPATAKALLIAVEALDRAREAHPDGNAALHLVNADRALSAIALAVKGDA